MTLIYIGLGVIVFWLICLTIGMNDAFNAVKYKNNRITEANGKIRDLEMRMDKLDKQLGLRYKKSDPYLPMYVKNEEH